jgi:hypothetical protein
LRREEEVEATGLEDDLDKDRGQDSEKEEDEGHEEGEEGHEDGAGLYDEGVGGGDESASGSAPLD